MLRLALAGFTLLLLDGCSCGKKCEPGSTPGSCDGDAIVFCQDGRKYGLDFGTHMQRTSCATGNACREFGEGLVGCLHLPATRCDIEKYVGGCDGDAPLACASPSSFVTEEWVIALPPCASGQRCVETPQGAECRSK